MRVRKNKTVGNNLRIIDGVRGELYDVAVSGIRLGHSLNAVFSRGR
jgi:hypothetical protein